MTDRYSKAYAQIEQETERYLRDNTLCEGKIDRYGFGKHILRLLMSGLAMHAMGHFMGGSGASGGAAQKGGGIPVSGDFEKLHPRGQSKNAGQFAEKPGKGISQGIGATASKDPKAGKADDLFNQAMASQAATNARSEKIKQNFGKPSFPAPQPMDATTAAVAEKWHGDKQEPAVDPPASPRNYPDNLGKPPEQQTPYAPPERTIEPTDDDLTAMQEDPYNYDPEQAAPTQQSKAELMEFPVSAKRINGDYTDEEAEEEHLKLYNEGYDAGKDPKAQNPYHPKSPQWSSWNSGNGVGGLQQNKPTIIEAKATTQAQPQAEQQQSQPDEDARAQQQAEARAKRNAEHAAKVAAEKAAKPTRSEQKAAAKRVEFDPSDWMNDDKPESLQDVAAKHGLDHEVFKKHIDEMEKFDQEQWRNHRSLQAAVRKHIGSNTRTRQAANEGKKGYEEFHDIESALSGNIPHETLVEHFGHDTQDWDSKAYEMANSPAPEKPGRHDPEWVAKHAKTFAERHEIADNANHQQHYPEPEDGAPFSRKALTAELDRYFNEARIQYRHRRQSEASAIWTDKDLWL